MKISMIMCSTVLFLAFYLEVGQATPTKTTLEAAIRECDRVIKEADKAENKYKNEVKDLQDMIKRAEGDSRRDPIAYPPSELPGIRSSLRPKIAQAFRGAEQARERRKNAEKTKKTKQDALKKL